MWQDPQATSYIGLSLAAMEASGIPVGVNVYTGALYEKDKAQLYDDIMAGKK
jgi:simple sugar transport system substrate-binding protein